MTVRAITIFGLVAAVIVLAGVAWLIGLAHYRPESNPSTTVVQPKDKPPPSSRTSIPHTVVDCAKTNPPATNQITHRRPPLSAEMRASFDHALAKVEDRLVSPLTPDERERALLEKGRLLLVLDRATEALEIYSSLIISTTNRATLESALAKYFMTSRDTGNLDREIANRERLLNADPKNVRSMEILAYMYRYTIAPDKEIELREDLATATTDPVHLERLLALYERNGNLQSLANTYERLAQVVDPTTAFLCLTKKAEVEIQAKLFVDARATCSRVLALKELTLSSRARVAMILGLAGENNEALAILEECAKEARSPAERERYELERFKMRVALGQRDESIIQGLQILSTNAVTRGVRRAAASSVAQIK